MFHVRIVCDPELTDRVLGSLGEVQGLEHVVVTPNVVQDPRGGSLIQADVLRSSAQEVLDRMEALAVERTGEITLIPTEIVVSDRVDRMLQRSSADPEDAVIWEDLLSQTREESQLNPVYFTFLTLACLLAVLGIIADSAVTIVGAMVVCPDFGPLAALSVATVSKRKPLARRSAMALGLGYPLAMAVTAVLVGLAAWVGWFDPRTALEHTSQVSFVYQVGAVSALTALVAGAAGMLALTSAKSGALIGVFISVTTVPAAGYVALSAVAGDWAGVGSGALQLLVNMVGVVVAGTVVLALRRNHPTRGGGGSITKLSTRKSA